MIGEGARVREALHAEHQEGEIGGDAYHALQMLVVENGRAIAAALELAEADHARVEYGRLCDYCDGDEPGHEDDCPYARYRSSPPAVGGGA